MKQCMKFATHVWLHANTSESTYFVAESVLSILLFHTKGMQSSRGCCVSNTWGDEE